MACPSEREGTLMAQQRTIIVVAVATLLVGSAGIALAVGSETVEPPPSFAFVATASNFPDALAVGPVAGRLNAPLFLTSPASLDDHARDGLEEFDPDIVVIAGGPVAISQPVEDEIAAALPKATVRRAAGATRTETARLVADIITEFNPAFLPADGKAADSALLDGMDASAFVQVGEASAVDAHAAPGTGGSEPPETAPTDVFFGAMETAFTTTRTGVLHLTVHASAGVNCHSPGVPWAWVTLNDEPLHHSMTRMPSGDLLPYTLTAVTVDPVPAGDHTMHFAAGCVGASVNSASWFNYARGTVLVID